MIRRAVHLPVTPDGAVAECSSGIKMKLVKKIRLAFREGKSDKVYEVDLVELPGNEKARYLVNFRFGRRGSALREGTKTARGVTLAEAEALYRSVVVSKTNSGYREVSGDAPATTRSPPPRAGADSTASRQASRTAALLEALEDENDSKLRARLIWNLGQGDPLPDLVPITAKARRGSWVEDYAIAWTLGRWREGAAIATLEQLRRHDHAAVRELALEALLVTSSGSQAANLVHAEKDELPGPLRSALDACSEADIAAALTSLASQPSAALNRALVICYHQALFLPAAQRALLKFFAGCALGPGVFKGLRHVFKAAEMRVDYDMFACLAHRFDTTPAFFRSNYDWVHIPGQGSITPSKELTRDNSRLAYSQRTRAYLRRRAWRALRRLGNADSAHYVALAVAVLLQVSDADAVEPVTRQRSRWNFQTRRTEALPKKEFDAFAPLTLFNHILRGANPAYRLSSTGAAWVRIRPDENSRGEPFAHLWDRAPAAALDLLKRSRCEPVHDAALRMLAGQREFLDALSGGEIAQLLLSPYPQTARFALPLAQALFAHGAGDDHLMLALLQSTLPEAREFGTRVLEAQPNWTANQSLLIELLLVFDAPVPAIVDRALEREPPPAETQAQVVAGVIGQVLARNLAIDAPVAEALAQLLAKRLPQGVAALPLTLLDRLLSQPELGRQLLGARLLVAGNLEFSAIPGRLLQHIHGSAHEEVRAVAIALLSRQTTAQLLEQADSLAELLYQGSAVERREFLALFERLASGGGESEDRVLRALSPLLFRGEQDAGQNDDLVAFFARHQAGAARLFAKDMVWRLLQAQAVGAQRVGSSVLQLRAAGEFTVRQWARLGQHPDLAVRQFAMRAYEADEVAIKSNARDALRIFDTKWNDAREFAFGYFRERFGDADWNPEFIVGICDSNQPDVQAFGRELLQRFFHQEQGPHYLASLSEHPSVNVQLFVSNFLESHAAGQRERILALRGYFVTVLSLVNKARVCKDRVLEFLVREALRDPQVAAMVAEVFTRVSLTVVRQDRSQLISALIALQNAFPQLPVPIRALPVMSRGI
jgi:hypothetical protein